MCVVTCGDTGGEDQIEFLRVVRGSKMSKLLFDTQFVLQTDWGPDLLWCNAARSWDSTQDSCVLITTPVVHTDCDGSTKPRSI